MQRMNAESQPSWIRDLRNDAQLNRDLDLAWLDPHEQDALRDDWLAVWNQVPYGEHFHAQCRERLGRCVPLAQGLKRERRLSHTSSQLVLTFDPDDPDTVFGNLSHAMPSMLWVRAQPTVDGIRAALAPYLVAQAPSVVELPRTLRLVKSLDIEDRAVIERSIENLELWMDDATWASAFEEDPWLGAPERLNMLDMAAWTRDVAQEHPDRFPSLSWRSLWSKGVLRIERHPFGMWAFELRYAPAKDRTTIDLVNELLSSRLPDDLPVDLAASLLRGGCLGMEYVRDLEVRNELPVDRAGLSCALAPGEMTAFAALEKLMHEHHDDAELLGLLGDLASRYRHDELLFEMAVLTRGTKLGQDLLTFLSPRSNEAPSQEAP